MSHTVTKRRRRRPDDRRFEKGARGEEEAKWNVEFARLGYPDARIQWKVMNISDLLVEDARHT